MGLNKREYLLTRSKRRSIAVYVRDGRIEVRAPLRMPVREIESFVRSKERWIEDRLTLLKDLEERRAAFTLDYGSMALYRGKEYPIAAKDGSTAEFDLASERFLLPPGLTPEGIRTAMTGLYRKLAADYVSEKLDFFQDNMGVYIAGFGITNAEKRWGSMNSRKKVNFTWRLIMAPDDVIDFIVVHELAHITEMNHSNRFRAIVEGVLPDWKERSRRLKEFAGRLAGENWTISRTGAINGEG